MGDLVQCCYPHLYTTLPAFSLFFTTAINNSRKMFYQKSSTFPTVQAGCLTVSPCCRPLPTCIFSTDRQLLSLCQSFSVAAKVNMDRAICIIIIVISPAIYLKRKNMHLNWKFPESNNKKFLMYFYCNLNV